MTNIIGERGTLHIEGQDGIYQVLDSENRVLFSTELGQGVEKAIEWAWGYQNQKVRK